MANEPIHSLVLFPPPSSSIQQNINLLEIIEEKESLNIDSQFFYNEQRVQKVFRDWECQCSKRNEQKIPNNHPKAPRRLFHLQKPRFVRLCQPHEL